MSKKITTDTRAFSYVDKNGNAQTMEATYTAYSDPDARNQDNTGGTIIGNPGISIQPCGILNDTSQGGPADQVREAMLVWTNQLLQQTFKDAGYSQDFIDANAASILNAANAIQGWANDNEACEKVSSSDTGSLTVSFDLETGLVSASIVSDTGDVLTSVLDSFEKYSWSKKFTQSDSDGNVLLIKTTDDNGSITLIGSAADDNFVAGQYGDVLDGSAGQNQYTGGAGADTFVIGNGIAAAYRLWGSYSISNAGDDDRLVLRLSDARSPVGLGNLTAGIVLNGGVHAVSPNYNDPDLLVAKYSSILVRPDEIVSQGDFSTLRSTVLDAIRPDLGFVEVEYDWYRLESHLSISVTSSYGDFSIEVDGFQNGQLGLTFVDADMPLTSSLPETDDIVNSWNSFNSALDALVRSTTIVSLPSPGAPVEGAGSPAVPLPGLNWVPDIGYPDVGGAATSGTSAMVNSQLLGFVQAMASYDAGQSAAAADANVVARQPEPQALQLAAVA
ncbi:MULTISPECIES: calcium-binding protein [unclassified Bradyrhizobium]|uniref:calcium-binding protein n=1 Tax=unclassified Bradyrhizobium TaxID=2631580 RepID=UPI0028F071A5|nr:MULTISPECIES: calcium-binding protein [unclassified Bradyrhizobium]